MTVSLVDEALELLGSETPPKKVLPPPSKPEAVGDVVIEPQETQKMGALDGWLV